MESSEILDEILLFLGMTRHEFEVSEQSRFELAPREWMREKLACLGYEQKTTAEEKAAC